MSDPCAWHGIWGFPLTPFTEHGIDAELLAQATDRQVAGGVDVLCACGLIAQLEQLSTTEHRRCTETIIAAAAGRIPVLITVMATPDAPGIAAAAAEHGAAGIVLVPRSPDPDVTLKVLRDIAEAAPGLPQVLYHRHPLRLAGDQLRRLADVPELAWVKDGHRDARLFRRLRGAVERLRWVSAWEDVALAFWAMGCEAFAPASTAYAPQYARGWLAALQRGDLAGARALLAAHAYPMVDLRLSRPDIDVSVVKEAMRVSSVPTGLTRPPARELEDAECARVRELVNALGRDISRRVGQPNLP
ncbi:MAG TPA: dihydrodipicolinate synthase family protein [Solirubrobacteraceae bacterium]